MKDSTSAPPDEADLHAYVDGKLSPEQRAAVEARLAADPNAASFVRQWTEQRELLRGLHVNLLHQPVPPSLLAAAQRFDARDSRRAHWKRWGAMAASLIVAFGIGWAGHGEWQEHVADASVQPASAFARHALVAHAVYAPEVRHPVEVEAAQQQHLVQWLSKRLDRPLKIPDLSPAGYELVGGRLLPGGDGARAQLMYQSASGDRVTLYVGAIDAKPGQAMKETAFRYTAEGGVASFYWVDQGFGYALSGKLPRQGLLALAESVYRQL